MKNPRDLHVHNSLSNVAIHMYGAPFVSKICIFDEDCEINPTDLIVNFNRRDLAICYLNRLDLYLERRDLNGIDLIIWIDAIINLLSKVSYNNHNVATIVQFTHD